MILIPSSLYPLVITVAEKRNHKFVQLVMVLMEYHRLRLILAGQHKNYLVHSLKGYRSGEKNIIIEGFAENLSDQDIEDLSVYFSMQKGLTIPPLK